MIRRQQGVAIVLALFFLALVAGMAYWMMGRLERDTRRVSLLLQSSQAENVAEGSIAWAMEQLRDNYEKQKPGQPVDRLPIHSPVDEVNGYRVESTINDMQARLNVNGLMDQRTQLNFKRLFTLLVPEWDEAQSEAVLQAIIDWITPNAQQSSDNTFYVSQQPPYRAAHRPMLSSSELYLIKGMTPRVVERLLPYVTALPIPTSINVLTAPAPVLASLSDTMTLETGRAIEAMRASHTIATVDAFLNLDIIKNHPPDKERLTAVSGFFLVSTTVTHDDQKITLYTLMERMNNNGQAIVHVVWQSKGVMG